MILISHRGNIDKINTKEEIANLYFQCLNHNFNVELIFGL